MRLSTGLLFTSFHNVCLKALGCRFARDREFEGEVMASLFFDSAGDPWSGYHTHIDRPSHSLKVPQGEASLDKA